MPHRLDPSKRKDTMIIPRIPIPVPVHATGDALVALDRFLGEFNYTSRSRSDARRIVQRTGCVADCVPSCLDPEHLEAAEEEYVAALPVVPFDDGAWGDPGSWMTVDDLMNAGRRVPRSAVIFPPALTDAELAAYWPGSDS
jgi:hypothetical protein